MRKQKAKWGNEKENKWKSLRIRLKTSEERERFNIDKQLWLGCFMAYQP